MESNDLLNRYWYMAFCNNEEIDRILSPKTPKDFLLQERANTVADNIRYYRVYRNKANYFRNWSFEKSFSDRHYLQVYHNLSKDKKEQCKNVTFGDMFSNDVNGYAIKNQLWGRIICLNEALQFYMKFCNLSILNVYDIPDSIRTNALRIAIRVLLKSEAMDFFMDPRGTVPQSIGTTIHRPIKHELQFIAGHEFAHHLLGHLDDDNVTTRNILSVGSNHYSMPVYNTSQQHEFEADIKSLEMPEYNARQYELLYNSALLWFSSLQLGEVAQDYIFPSMSLVKTHPSAEERLDNILQNCKRPKEFDIKKIEIMQEQVKRLRDFLLEDLAVNFDFYEVYGSAYLDSPNTEWRGKELVDRVDYY